MLIYIYVYIYLPSRYVVAVFYYDNDEVMHHILFVVYDSLVYLLNEK